MAKRVIALVCASALLAAPAAAGRRKLHAPGVASGYGSDLTLEWIAQRKRPLFFKSPKTWFYLSPEAGGEFPLGSDANDGLTPETAVASCAGADALIDATPHSIVVLDAGDTLNMGSARDCLTVDLDDPACNEWEICYGLESSDPSGVTRPTIIGADTNGGAVMKVPGGVSRENRAAFYMAGIDYDALSRDLLSAESGGVGVMMDVRCESNVSLLGATDDGHCTVTKNLGMMIVANSTFIVKGGHPQEDSVAGHFAWTGSDSRDGRGLGGIAINVAYEMNDTTFAGLHALRCTAQPCFWIGGTLTTGVGSLVSSQGSLDGLIALDPQGSAFAHNNGLQVEVSDFVFDVRNTPGLAVLLRHGAFAVDSTIRLFEFSFLGGGLPIYVTGDNVGSPDHTLVMRYGYLPESMLERNKLDSGIADWGPALIYQNATRFDDGGSHEVDIAYVVTDRNPATGLNGSGVTPNVICRFANPTQHVSQAAACTQEPETTTSCTGIFAERAFPAATPLVNFYGGDDRALCSDELDLSQGSVDRDRAALGLPGYRHDFWNAGTRNGVARVDRDRLRIPAEVFGVEIRGFDREPVSYGARREPD